MSVQDFVEITKTTPEKRLTKGKSSSGGRNNRGKITSYHRGGGHKKRYRQIDFRRDKRDIPAKVAAIEYDPNRSARIALLHYADGDEALHPRAGRPERRRRDPDRRARRDQAGQRAAAAADPDRLARAQHRAQARRRRAARALGGHGRAADGARGEVRAAEAARRARRARCSRPASPRSARSATSSTRTWPIGKAGRSRWLGIRPNVRGVAMNPVDHPHGGGEGRTSGGRHPVSPWGQPTKGHKTRNNRRTDVFIVRRRGQK